MKHSLRFILATIVAIICLGNSKVFADDKKTYSLFDPDSGVLTFYYKVPSSVTTASEYYHYIGDNWQYSYKNKKYAKNIIEVVFDHTFIDSKPDYLRFWLKELPNLEKVSGWKYVNWTGSKISSFNEMFLNCSKLTDLGDFDKVNSVNIDEMQSMFSGCSSLRYVDLSSFNTAKVTKMSKTFYNCTSLESIFVGEDWSTTKVSSSTDMFSGCTNLKGTPNGIEYKSTYTNDKSYATTSKYLSTKSGYQAYAYYKNNVLTFTINDYKTWKAYSIPSGNTTPGWISDHAKDIKKVVFDNTFTSNVNPTSTYEWFSGCTNLTEIEGLLKLNTNAITTTSKMFAGCSSLYEIKFSTKTYFNNVKNFNNMFAGCTYLTSLYLPSRNGSTSSTMSAMFYGCKYLSLDFFKTYNITNVTSMNYMFAQCNMLKSFTSNLSYFKIDKATDMSYMFYGCANLEDASFHLSLATLTNCKHMFQDCAKLKKVYFFNETTTSKLTNTEYMFSGDKALESIIVSSNNSFYVGNVTSSTNMFEGCTKLKGGRGTTATITDKSFAHIDNGPSDKGLFTPYKSKITYELNGGTAVSGNPSTYTFDDSFTLKQPGRQNYAFAGWTCSGGLEITTPTLNLTINAGTANDLVLTAHWLIDISVGNKITLSLSSETYTGKPLNVVVKDNNTILTEGVDYKLLTSTTIKNAGKYNITIQGLGKYDGQKSATLTLKGAPLTVTTLNAEKQYGEPDPKFNYTVQGFFNNDTYTFETYRDANENVGTYPIKVVTPTSGLQNYQLNTVSGNLTIKAKNLTIVPDELSKQYGASDPILTYTAPDLKTGDVLSGNLSRKAGEDVGQYEYVSNLTNANYNISVAPVKFTITPKTVVSPTIVFDSDITIYTGQAVEVGVKLFDNDKLIPASEYTVTYTNNINKGTATATINDVAGGNYTISTASANFQIVGANEAYKVTYITNGHGPANKVVYVAKNSKITLPADMTAEGYTLEGIFKDNGFSNEWIFASDVVTNDITLYAKWTINKYNLSFYVDGVLAESSEVEYGSTITAYTVAPQEGHTFAWLDEIPTTMPAHNIQINGIFTINSYKLVYMLDGKEYYSETLEYGKTITPQPNPASKPGYTFSGWTPSSLPPTMPNKDITVTGSYIPNKHTITFKVNDETFVVETEFNASTASLLPQKPGYKFVPSATLAATMPDENLVVEGSWQMSVYTLTYKVDGKEHQKFEMHYGDAITLIAAPTKEGHNFSGWSKAPATMPDNDLTITGKFSANQYTVTFVIDGETYKTVTMYYGDIIIAPTVASKSGYTFVGWDNVPATMPASDITIKGSYSANNTTPVVSITQSEDIKVWAYNRTIYIETAHDTKYTIVDLQGRIITTSTTKSTHEEVHTNQSGILIVKIGNQTFKLAL